VKRLAVIGQKLMTELRPSPEDAQQDERAAWPGGDFEGDEFGVGQMPPRLMNQIIGAGNDQQQMVRELMALLGPAFGGLKGQSDAQRRAHAARELNNLLEARVRLELDKPSQSEAIERLTKRIDAILVAMQEEEKKEGDEDGLHMVPAVDVRRYQAGEADRVIDAAHVDGPFPDREGRRAGALPEGDEAGGAPHGMVHGG
jgi:hypothetical protein